MALEIIRSSHDVVGFSIMLRQVFNSARFSITLYIQKWYNWTFSSTRIFNFQLDTKKDRPKVGAEPFESQFQDKQCGSWRVL